MLLIWGMGDMKESRVFGGISRGNMFSANSDSDRSINFEEVAGEM